MTGGRPARIATDTTEAVLDASAPLGISGFEYVYKDSDTLSYRRCGPQLVVTTDCYNGAVRYVYHSEAAPLIPPVSILTLQFAFMCSSLQVQLRRNPMRLSQVLVIAAASILFASEAIAVTMDSNQAKISTVARGGSRQRFLRSYKKTVEDDSDDLDEERVRTTALETLAKSWAAGADLNINKSLRVDENAGEERNWVNEFKALFDASRLSRRDVKKALKNQDFVPELYKKWDKHPVGDISKTVKADMFHPREKELLVDYLNKVREGPASSTVNKSGKKSVGYQLNQREAAAVNAEGILIRKIERLNSKGKYVEKVDDAAQ
ncbi:unnamed protein product [Phytophthora fragariaefolia]|uniref:RxLR effector protein n=1 Tax=Phytophthora fragariaefolia TaxID=1490495 RepID=A0A9W6Y842_9STRA|nr:unnamed protein product [Phytophthora fragariaefolia]